MTDEQNNQFEGAIFEMYDNSVEFTEGKIVDLVRYTDTYDRVILGKAEVLANGSFRMRIGDEAVKQMFETQLNRFSIAEDVQKKLFPKVDPFEKVLLDDTLTEEMNAAGRALVKFAENHGLTPEQVKEQLDKSWRDHVD